MVETVEQVKPCPYCGEAIKPGALVCRHCRRDLFNPDAPPIVGQHDWEREKPPEKVVFTVRLPVSERQWTRTCYALAAAVGFFWIGIARRPAPAPPPDPALLAKRAAAHSSAGHTLTEGYATATPSAPSTSIFGESGHVPAESVPRYNPNMAPSFAPANDTGATSGDTSSNTGSGATSEDTGAVLNGADIIRLYDTQPDVAEDRYTHKPITVVGRVIAIGRAADGSPFLALSGTSDTHVKCLFTSLKKQAPPKIAVGAEVKISGTCEGRFLDIMIADCRLEF